MPYLTRPRETIAVIVKKAHHNHKSHPQPQAPPIIHTTHPHQTITNRTDEPRLHHRDPKPIATNPTDPKNCQTRAEAKIWGCGFGCGFVWISCGRDPAHTKSTPPKRYVLVVFKPRKRKLGGVDLGVDLCRFRFVVLGPKSPSTL